MDGRRAAGVRVLRDGRNVQVRAGRVIVTAGAVQSPAILLRAGIGPAAALRDLGIDVVIERPGVGRNLRDHPALTFCQFLPRRSALAVVAAAGELRRAALFIRHRGLRSLRHVCHRVGPRRLARAWGAARSVFSLVQPALFGRAGLAGVAGSAPASRGRSQPAG